MSILQTTESMISDAKQEYGVLIHEVIILRNEYNTLVDEIKEKKKILAEMEKKFTDLSLKELWNQSWQ